MKVLQRYTISLFSLISFLFFLSGRRRRPSVAAITRKKKRKEKTAPGNALSNWK
jgi:hypothetical protein